MRSGESPLHGIAPEPAAAGNRVWVEIAPELTPAEFRYPEAMDAGFLRLLHRARRRAGVPFRVVSDHRPPERNEKVRGAKRSAHLEVPCRAVDLRVASNQERWRVVEALLEAGFVRVGLYPAHADGSGSVHVDASESNPAPSMWTRHGKEGAMGP